MKITDLLAQHNGTAFSFEVLPPLKGNGIGGLKRTIDRLRNFNPQYINITTHRSEYVYKDLGDGLMQRSRVRRRPGTIAVAAAIQNEYNIPVVPHILCSGFTRAETEYVLLDLQFLGIENLLVLRGDKAKEDAFFKPTETATPTPPSCRSRSIPSTLATSSTAAKLRCRENHSLTVWPATRRSMRRR